MLRNVKIAFSVGLTVYISAMALSKKSVGLIITLIILSLTGLVTVQTALLSYARGVKEQAFRSNVLTAMNSASQRLEANETYSRTGGDISVTASISGDAEMKEGFVWTGAFERGHHFDACRGGGMDHPFAGGNSREGD